jgi:starvation-inducible outer membrane lipoprotein
MKHFALSIAAAMLVAACTSIPDGLAPVENFQADRYLETGTRSRDSTILSSVA